MGVYRSASETVRIIQAQIFDLAFLLVHCLKSKREPLVTIETVGVFETKEDAERAIRRKSKRELEVIYDRVGEFYDFWVFREKGLTGDWCKSLYIIVYDLDTDKYYAYCIVYPCFK